MIDTGEATEDITAILNYANDRGLSANEVIVVGAFIAGVGVGQLSGQDESARREGIEDIKNIAGDSAEMASDFDVDPIPGPGRWRD